MHRALIALLPAVAAVDQCSMFSSSCLDCLNISSPTGEGGRTNCGWCASGVTFPDGTTGPKCADIRMHNGTGFKCQNAEFDTYKCNKAWNCNFTTGQCVQDATPGEGLSRPGGLDHQLSRRLFN